MVCILARGQTSKSPANSFFFFCSSLVQVIKWAFVQIPSLNVKWKWFPCIQSWNNFYQYVQNKLHIKIFWQNFVSSTFSSDVFEPIAKIARSNFCHKIMSTSKILTKESTFEVLVVAKTNEYVADDDSKNPSHNLGKGARLCKYDDVDVHHRSNRKKKSSFSKRLIFKFSHQFQRRLTSFRQK